MGSSDGVLHGREAVATLKPTTCEGANLHDSEVVATLEVPGRIDSGPTDRNNQARLFS
jgi:hypothetical protein